MTLSDDLLHIALPDEWSAAQIEGVYRMSTRGVTLDQEGFIHCSYPHQLVGVANRFYADVSELVLLRIDPDLVDAEIVVEPPVEGATELFPHIYGEVPVDTVIATTWWDRDDDGIWRRPATM